MISRPNATPTSRDHRNTTDSGAASRGGDAVRDGVFVAAGALLAACVAVGVDYALVGGAVPALVAVAVGLGAGVGGFVAGLSAGLANGRRRTRRISAVPDDAAGQRQLVAELQHARREADRRNREFAALEAAVRHPVADLLAIAERVGEHGLAAGDDELLESLRMQARALDDRVAVLTELGRLERGVATLEPVDVDLADLCERAVEARRSLARHDDVNLRVRLNPRLARNVRTDPERLWAILGALIDNAVRAAATALGPRTVTVDVSTGDRNGDRVPLRIEVRDSGQGLDPARLAGLLADGDTDGDGLGLRFAARLVALMGGRLDGESTVGSGTVIRFEVPIESASPSLLGVGPTAALHVAVVADNPALRRAVGWMLEGQVAWHLGIGSGAEFADLADVADLDVEVIVIDTALGPDAVERAVGTGAQVVALVADESAAGDPLAVPKPVRPGRLMDALRAASTRQRGGSGANLVVIAEDNSDLQLVLAGFVAASGYDVEICPNGRRAVEAYRSRPDDVVAVLLDCHMPLLDGFGAAREVRAHELRSGLAPAPLIGLGTSVGAADRDRAAAAGMDDFLDKPLTADAVSAMLARWAPRTPVGAGIAVRSATRQYGSR